ncbi:MAG: polysaccharide pyruvyl transferase family protein [Ruminococcaceae bacterium]|nr:polysaccharide pyruvyl transferase family protein [Oscillospiraceae bacterium]
MKIATLTFHASHNYGSVLQAYALAKQLELMGNEVNILNLRPETQKQMYTLKKPAGDIMHKCFDILMSGKRKKRYSEFERFIASVLPVTDEEFQTTEQLKKHGNAYDAYICGSDQIWNPVCPDFEPAYYLQFLSDTARAKKIAYAPSFGKHEFDEATTKQINAWAKDFDSISVRELKGKAVLNEIAPEKISVVCDPVVLLDKMYWDEFAAEPNIKEPYMLVYFLENNHGRKDFIDELSKTLGLKVVVLTEYLRDMAKPYIKKYDASPEEFVGLFQNASFVYTNSFHGTAFATIFNKPFITVIAPDQKNAANNNDSRKIDYLTKIGLESRLVQNDLPDKDMLMHVDYGAANEKMQEFREFSYRYLKNALEG